jgi:hypothetical protein
MALEIFPLIDKLSPYNIFFANIGQFPIADGLFEWARLAYFSALQPSLTTLQPDVPTE